MTNMIDGLIRDIRLAARNLLRNKNRSAVALLTVAGGVVAFLLAGGFITWILRDGREATIHSQLGHAQIVRPGYFERGIAEPYAFVLPASAKELDALKQITGVVSITPRLAINGLISHGDTTLAFAGDGIDPVGEQPISKRITLLTGLDLVSADERRVLIGEGLAKSLGVRPGDTVVLLTTAANGSASAIEVAVYGIFATITKEYDDYAIRLPIEQARKLMRVTGATSWVVLLDDTEQTSAFIATVRTKLPASAFQVVAWRDLADFFNKTEALFSKQVRVMQIIIGLIIILTITNTLTMSLLERTTEIGTSLAVGVGKNTVMHLFVIEGIFTGVVGGVLGVMLGLLLATAISAIGIPMPAAPGMAHGYVAQISITPSLAIDAMTMAMLTTLLASAFPAWKAGRLNIVDALRYSQ
jgi:putative ABC transport system permease protein